VCAPSTEAAQGWLVGGIDGVGPRVGGRSRAATGSSAIEVLIDGEAALARIAEAIAAASSHVYLAGWCLSAEFALTTGDCPAILRQLLAETSSS